MLDAETLSWLVAVLALLGYVVWVNRKRQIYAKRALLDAPIDAVWDVLDIRPGKANWIPTTVSTTWIDEAAGDMEIAYQSGDICRFKILSAAPPHSVETVARYTSRGSAEFGDLLASRTVLSEEGGKTAIASSTVIERGPFLRSFGKRLSYPLMNVMFVYLLRAELERRGHAASPHDAAAAGRRVPSLTQALLAAAAIAWLVYEFGWSFGLAALACLVVHEYGHVWSMRRHGATMARMYLVPFFGGVAISGRPFRSDAEGAEVMLMGPAFGALPGLALVLLYWLSGDIWFAAAGVAILALNLVNLFPVPPLDGGRVIQFLLRPLGDRIWFVMSGLLILGGTGGTLYLGLKFLTVFFIVAAVMWSAAPTPPADTPPLGKAGIAATLAAYLALIGLHAGVIFLILAQEPFRMLARALATGLQIFD